MSLPNDPPSLKQNSKLEDFWRCNFSRLMKRARRFANGHDEIAEDLVATSMVKIVAYMRCASRPIDDIESLAFVTLRNVAYDHWRKRRRSAQQADAASALIEEDAAGDGFAEEAIFYRQIFQHVMHVIECEEGVEQSLFHKRFVQQLSYADVAEQLDISEALARKRVQTLRKRLKASLKTKYDAEPFTAAGNGRLRSAKTKY